MPIKIRTRREALGLAQGALASAANVSRQTLNAIEAGRSMPSVDVALRLASALGASVEDLFGKDDERSSVPVSGGDEGPTSRRVVARVRDKWVAHALGEREHDVAADGLVNAHEVELLRPIETLRDNVFVMGCAPALGILCDRLSTGRSMSRFVWLPRASEVAVRALVSGMTHVAGLHLIDGKGAEANVAHVKRHHGSLSITLVTFARWEMGLVIAKGNPKRIRRAGDVARRGVRLVGRERASNPSRLLHRFFHAAGVHEPTPVVSVPGHREIAQSVVSGAADVGPAPRDVAVSYGLDFIPLVEERFDLAFASDTLESPQARRLLDALTAAETRRELSALGYDVRETGVRVTS